MKVEIVNNSGFDVSIRTASGLPMDVELHQLCEGLNGKELEMSNSQAYVAHIINAMYWAAKRDNFNVVGINVKLILVGEGAK